MVLGKGVVGMSATICLSERRRCSVSLEAHLMGLYLLARASFKPDCHRVCQEGIAHSSARMAADSAGLATVHPLPSLFLSFAKARKPTEETCAVRACSTLLLRYARLNLHSAEQLCDDAPNERRRRRRMKMVAVQNRITYVQLWLEWPKETRKDTRQITCAPDCIKESKDRVERSWGTHGNARNEFKSWFTPVCFFKQVNHNNSNCSKNNALARFQRLCVVLQCSNPPFSCSLRILFAVAVAALQVSFVLVPHGIFLLLNSLF
ncbi:unnamed protein product [Durusdinium trenchii]|uniref:Transmembrane protein n=1 Tax=Durusdinium trenchii TaxID=1381693 RepID=A0ABP0LL53_9DINO